MKWEYRLDLLAPDKWVSTCNELGSKGWELISQEYAVEFVDKGEMQGGMHVATRTPVVRCYFKRPNGSP